MAKSVPITPGSGANIAARENGEGNFEQLVADLSTEERLEAIRLLLSAPLTVADGGGSLTVDDGGLSLTVDGTVSLGAGSNAIGKLAEGTAKIGKVELEPRTSGGVAVKRVLATASTNATSVKASPGQVYGFAIFNTSSAVRYVKLYNKASAPTVGTDTPVMTLMIPKEGGVVESDALGIEFPTGIALATTKGVTDANTEAVAENDLIINLYWK